VHTEGEWANGKRRKGLCGWEQVFLALNERVFYMTVEGSTACLLFVGVVEFVWRVVSSLAPPVRHTVLVAQQGPGSSITSRFGFTT